MFEIPQPSMALNSHDVPPPDYKMFNSYKVDKEATANHMLAWTAKVADGQKGGLRCLVINCHGSPGRLHIGKGICSKEARHFRPLKGKVHSIFIVACEIAQMGSAYSRAIGFDGNLFCGSIAKESGAYVFCSTATQKTSLYGAIGLPYGAIDEYEGTVYQYNPDGSNKLVDNAYITTWVRNLKLGVKRPW